MSRPRRSEVVLALTAVLLGTALTWWLLWLIPDHPLLMVIGGYTGGLLLVLLAMDVASRIRDHRYQERLALVRRLTPDLEQLLRQERKP